MSDANTLIPPGTLLDEKYRIEGTLGTGGMGTVYEATQEAIGRKVAIKLLHREHTSDPNVVTRFQQEARMAGSIGHDNICEVTDFGTTADGTPYLAMPLLKGHSLAELLNKQKTMTIPRLVDIVCQVLSALQAAHDKKIVHRDLSPSNIFITKLGDRDDFVKLLDFGISKFLDQESVVEITRTGTIVGTPFYMSPEQAKGSKEIDKSVDIYAIGVIMYEALTGIKPFVGDSYNEIMFKIITEPFAAPQSLNPGIPLPVEQVVVKAMSKDPTTRFESADEMRSALLQAIAQDSATGDGGTTHSTTVVADVASAPFTPTSSVPSVRDGSTTPAPAAASAVASSTQEALAAGAGNFRKRAALIAFASAIVVAAGAGILLYSVYDGETDLKSVVVPLATPATQPTALPRIPSTDTEATAAEIKEAKGSPDEPELPAQLDLESAKALPEHAGSRDDQSKSSSAEKRRKKKRGNSGKKTATPAASKNGTTTGIAGRFGTEIISEYED